MKLLLSLVATLAATTVLTISLPSITRAEQTDSTNAAPNPSGFATCNGKNADGSAATWTVGGNITFTSDTMNTKGPYPWHNIRPGHSNPYSGQGGNPCIFQVSPSANMQSSTVVQVSMNLTYASYTGGGSPQKVDRRAVSGMTGGITYTYSTSTFTPLLDVNNVQFKVSSDQGTAATPGSALGTAATPYL